MTIKAVKAVLRILAIENKDRQAVKDVVEFLLKVMERSDFLPKTMPANVEEMKAIKIACFLLGHENGQAGEANEQAQKHINNIPLVVESLKAIEEGLRTMQKLSDGEWYSDLAKAIVDTLKKAIEVLTEEHA